VVTWHLLEDVLGWVAVLAASIVMFFWETPFIDPALSLLITSYVLWNVIKRLKETLLIFLQGVPKGINISEIEDEISKINGVQSVHHTHSWSLDGEHHVFSTHIKLGESVSLKQIPTLKKNVKNILKPYSFKHYTVETESHNELCELEN